MNLVAELRRRRVFRIAAMYIIASWAVLQVADLAFESWGLPEVALRYIWIAAFLLFPVALVFAWRYDLTAAGIVRTPPADGRENMDLSLATPDYLLLAALAVLAVLVLTGTLREVANAPAVGDTRSTAAAPDNSIAVLPFANMSADAENDFLADGLAEEILNALAQRGTLHVIARTSSFAFRDKSMDVRSIGQRLNARHVVEGSVRAQGNDVRVTAQLVDATSGAHVWSETFDADKKNLFKLQELVARAIGRALQSTLQTAPSASATQSGTENSTAYLLYLRALKLLGRGTLALEFEEDYSSAIEILKQAALHDDRYVEAYAAISNSHATLHIVDRWGDGLKNTDNIDHLAEARRYGEQALALNARSPEALVAMSIVHGFDKNYAEQERLLTMALQENPNYAKAEYYLALLYWDLGLKDKLFDHLLRAHRLDPVDSEINMFLAIEYSASGQLRSSSDHARLASEFSGFDREKLDTVVDAPRNLDFSAGDEPWISGAACNVAFRAKLDGNDVGYRNSTGNRTCALAQDIEAENYQGKILRLSADLRARFTDPESDANSALLYLWGVRDGQLIAFSNMGDGAIDKNVDWQRLETSIFVPEDTDWIRAGAAVTSGEIWFDNVAIEALSCAEYRLCN